MDDTGRKGKGRDPGRAGRGPAAGPAPGGSDAASADGCTDRPASASLYLRITVFIAGAGVMSAEMAAPRLLAPSFGTTQLIWTNIIGTVLAALTLGAFVGGRLADRWPSERAYARVLAASGILLAVVPIASRPLLDVAVRGLAGRHVGVFLASLAAVCLFFAPPTFLLGMVTPWAVRLAGAGRRDLGRVAGLLSGLGALGSILGTFVSSLVMLPCLGTRKTLLVTAGMIAAAGAWRAFDGWRPRWPWRAAGLVLAAGLLLAPRGRVRAAPGQLHEEESRYQYVQVVERPGTGRRFLILNEGNCYHSVKPERGVLTGGYWDCMAVLPEWASEPGGRLRVLVLGLAAGTMAAQLEHFWGESRDLTIDGVEIDPAVVEAGRRFFDMGSVKSLRVHVADARAFLAAAEGPYDVVIADAYRQPYIPFHMVTREFYRGCLEKLAPGGVFAMNVGAPERGADDMLDAFTATLGEAFPRVHRFRVANRDVPFSNFIYLCSRSDLDPGRLAGVRGALPERVVRTVTGTWETPTAPPGTLVFTDDRSPVELFMHRVVYRVAAGGGE